MHKLQAYSPTPSDVSSYHSFVFVQINIEEHHNHIDTAGNLSISILHAWMGHSCCQWQIIRCNIISKFHWQATITPQYIPSLPFPFIMLTVSANKVLGACTETAQDASSSIFTTVPVKGSTWKWIAQSWQRKTSSNLLFHLLLPSLPSCQRSGSIGLKGTIKLVAC